MRNKNGITLIALVITIIVLLILAGVSVVTLTGENGLLTKVQTAKTETTKAEARERVELELAEWGIVKNIQPDAKLVDFLSQKFGAENVTPNTDGGYIVTVDGYKVDVDANGKVTGIVINETADSITEVVTSYTSEEIEASDYLYAIGKNDPTYVVAAFNEDYTQVIITKNGEDSDGLIMDFAPWAGTSPMSTHSSTLEKAIIENGVANTGNGLATGGLFKECTELNSITIPNTVTAIEGNAFAGCTSLMNIVIPDSVTSIDETAFDSTGYYNESNNWDENVLYIGKHLIEVKTSKSGSYTIKAGTISVANSAFRGCKELTSIMIPNSVIGIGGGAFAGCSGLIDITIPDGVKSIGGQVFLDCISLTNITIPDGIKSIGTQAFSNCTSLAKVKIMSTALSVDNGGSFYNIAPNAKIYVLNEEVKTALEGTYDGTTTVEVVTEEQMKQL